MLLQKKNKILRFELRGRYRLFRLSQLQVELGIEEAYVLSPDFLSIIAKGSIYFRKFRKIPLIADLLKLWGLGIDAFFNSDAVGRDS